MMNLKRLLGMSVLALAGCVTISQTDFPAVEMSPAPQGAPAVSLSGFEATVTSYVPVYGYATVWNSTPSYCHHGRYHRGWDYPQTVSTTTYIPQTQLTTAYIEKAQENLETAGFLLSPTNAAYVVDVKFSGPVRTDGSYWAEGATVILSLLTADYTSAVWSARLKVTETATGRVVFSRHYDQEYASSVWGPIPLFSPFGSDKVDSVYIQNWCLSALTDRSMADVTAFLATLGKAG